MAEEQRKFKLSRPDDVPSNEKNVNEALNVGVETKESTVGFSGADNFSGCTGFPVPDPSQHSSILGEGDREETAKDLGKNFEDLSINNSTENHGAGSSLEPGDLSNSEKSNTNLDDDFIDDEALKTAELSYSEDDKKRLRAEAESLKTSGNEHFKSGKYVESIQSYTLGLRTCSLAYPKDRAILYANRAAAKVKLNLKSEAIEDCSKAVELDPTYLKAYFRRAHLYEETEKLDEALADYQTILQLDPLHREALYAHKRLPDMIQERNEKMKADMLAKLKDLGNMILRPFNLSTDNFQLNQDPNTGGYSVNFVQNRQ